VVGVGESIGTVYPLLGEGIIPSMQCVNMFVEHLDDMEAYSEAVLKHFDIYAKVYRFIKAKVDGNFSLLRHLPDMASMYWHMRTNERRYGLETKLGDILKVINV
jgi:flavin-dependent dehydrogenase